MCGPRKTAGHGRADSGYLAHHTQCAEKAIYRRGAGWTPPKATLVSMHHLDKSQLFSRAFLFLQSSKSFSLKSKANTVHCPTCCSASLHQWLLSLKSAQKIWTFPLQNLFKWVLKWPEIYDHTSCICSKFLCASFACCVSVWRAPPSSARHRPFQAISRQWILHAAT